jgi:homoserine dehydrogenase
MTQRIGIGLAGFGTVGAGVYKNLLRNAALLEQRIGVQFEVRKIAVRDLSKTRDVQAPTELFTDSPDELLADPSIHVVVELMGGIDIPLAFVKKAIAAGKIVITGNKALLAEHGHEIFQLAAEKRVPVFYEAAVAGGIPIIKSVREAFEQNVEKGVTALAKSLEVSEEVARKLTEAGMVSADVIGTAEASDISEAIGCDSVLAEQIFESAQRAIARATAS